MNKLFKGFFMLITGVAVLSCTTVKKNPFMVAFDTENGTPPYSEIKNEHFYPAFISGIEKSKHGINIIANNIEAPSFENTIEAFEFNGEMLDRVSGVFSNLAITDTNDTLQDISIKVSPLLADLSTYTIMNEKLFERIKTVYNNMDDENLTALERKLTENTYKYFSRNGAELKGKDKEIYGELSKKLSELSIQFDNNELKGTNTFMMELTEEQMKGLPQFVVEMARADAKAKDIDGWIITFQGPSYGAYMKYSSNSAVKEKLWRARQTLCLGGEYDNSKIVNQIVNTRLELANLLGYDTYADYVLEENMAESADNVNDFLSELSKKSMKYAKMDYNNVLSYAKKEGYKGDLKPWDLGYYTDQLMQAKYSFNDEVLKPYFELENVKNGIFELTEKLYGISYVKNTIAEPYQEEVEIYNVLDKDGSHLAVLYMDFFPRESKGPGAWMSTIADQKIVNGVESRPLVTVVCNFTKPTESTPSLLTHYEVVTFLHEFGHAMHGIFATGDYASLAGANTARDFVELPSQLMENWAYQKEFLSMFAKHYQTGEVIPNDLIDKVIKSKNFNAGYSNRGQISYSLLDMGWHSIDKKEDFDISEFEEQAMLPVAIIPYVKGTGMTTIFGHVFAGGYAAGYYSYKWAEVLEADAFEAFKESGIFNREMGEKLRETILSKGASEDAMDLFVDFRGHEPDIDALFKKYGME